MIRKTTSGRYTIADDQELTADLLGEYITAHKADTLARYVPLRELYKNDAEIFRAPRKAAYKPDNRLGVPFAKYLTDVFEGFFMGSPVRIDTSGDAVLADYVGMVSAYNALADTDAELSRLVSMYGHAYDMYFVDADGQIGITTLSPEDAWMIYDESILERPRYFVRIYKDAHGDTRGSMSDSAYVHYFVLSPGVVWTESRPHGFEGVPATEYVQNADRLGIYEGVSSLINAYNQVLSEKANDCDYFADAYLKVLGAKVKEEDLHTIRDDRIINFSGPNGAGVEVGFLDKPDGDGSQEHLIDRLERLIYQTSMVANISDQTFGSASGVALKYKLHAMTSLAKTKERKFTAGFTRRWRLICSNPVSPVPADAWTHLSYVMTYTMPSSLLEEAQTAAQLAGIVSRETQLKALSIVDDIPEELARLEKEDSDMIGGLPDERTNT